MHCMIKSVEDSAELVYSGIRTCSAITNTTEIFRRREVYVISHNEVVAIVTLLIDADSLMKFPEVINRLHHIWVSSGAFTFEYLRHNRQTIQLDTPVVGSRCGNYRV